MDTFFNQWPRKDRVLPARAVKFSSRVSVKCSVVRTTIYELATFRSSGFQWLFRSAMRPVFLELWATEIITYSFFQKSVYRCSFKNFYQSTGIVAGMSSLLLGTFVTGVMGYSLVWGSLRLLQTTGWCLLPPTWWYTWHLIDDEDPWYLIE